MENLKYTLDKVNDWIKTADQKAMILGSINIVGFIYQTINFEKVLSKGMLTIVLFTISIALTGLSLYFWIKIIYPRLSNKTNISKIYFSHIANAYENDRSKGVYDLQNLTEEEFKKDLADQIIVNSIVAKNKFTYIKKFIWVFGIQIIFVLLLLTSLI